MAIIMAPETRVTARAAEGLVFSTVRARTPTARYTRGAGRHVERAEQPRRAVEADDDGGAFVSGDVEGKRDGAAASSALSSSPPENVRACGISAVPG